MRVYEFAKEHNSTSKEILDLLKSEGYDIKSHISVIPEDALKKIQEYFSDIHKNQEPIVVDATNDEYIDDDFLTEEEESVNKSNTSFKKKSTNIKSSKSDLDEIDQLIKKNSLKKKNQSDSSEDIEFAKNSVPQPLLLQPMSIIHFAEYVEKPVSEIIISLLKEGQVCTKNHILTVEQVQKLARQYEIEVTQPSTKKTASDNNFQKFEAKVDTKEGVSRLPVVVVMGHVDHGKTSLLDYIRKTRVAAREKGGITQHLGAYEAQTPHGNIVFLDTPGHEAFSKIRQRGASVADIAVLVVAADDGVMPQTVESIKAIQAMKLPIVVAINKIDKADLARVEIIKRQLSQYGVLPEEWGGDTVCAPLSAKTGQGIEGLLEMILLQAEMLELKTISTVPAQGYVLESKMERGRGAVATVLCRQGVLKIGDYFNAGKVWGKVSSMVDCFGVPQKEVGASIPVVISGFEEFPTIGELLQVVPEEEYRKERGVKNRLNVLRSLTSDVTKESLPIIIKADTNSSLEAVLDGVEKISKNGDITFYIVNASVGAVTESDVILGETSNALVVGFHTKVENDATTYARTVAVKVLSFDIIYKLFEDLEARSKKEKIAEKKDTKIGEAVVLKVFDIKKLGVIAGCYIKEGRFSDQGTVIIKRGRKQVGEGKVKSLQRDKKQVKEVHTGYECAFIVDSFTEWQVDDVVECYIKI